MELERSIVLIPTLNEHENLEKLIPAMFNLIPDISILIVDDNSSDGTKELTERLKQNYHNLYILNRVDNFGYGHSNIDGFKWALEKNYDFLVTMDADFSHDFKVVTSFIENLENFDVVIGSRYIKGGGVTNWNLFRRILSRFANFYVRIILGLGIKDTTTGFNAYRVDCLRKINLEKIDSEGYAFLVELKYQLYRAGCRFIEYPIIFSERREGKSKMSGKIIWESIKLPWRLLKN